MIPLFWPQQFKSEWMKTLSKTFDTRWLGQGPLVDEFEEKFGEKFNYDHCVATNSGSAALELAYHLIDIREGDEVITPCLTCTATNVPLLRRKVKIIFADIGNNLLIDYKDVKKKITKNTKAIVVVTLGGLPVDKRIFSLAKLYGVAVVIDAAQSLGISEKYGDYICYSFQAIKHFTTGDGGMLILRDGQKYARAKKLRWFGIDREAKRAAGFNCLTERQINMEIEEPGYKYHMNDIAAALGLVGLKHTDELLEYRKELCAYYSKKLTGFKLIYGGSHWLLAVLTERRNGLIEYLRTSGVECDVVQLRNDIFQAFGGKRQALPNMNRLEEKYFYLPLHGKISYKDVDYIANVVKKWKKK